ncbi:DNA-binding FadR family transcriptional regulator [Kibdelosporangium banguiense]|uniref:DNA-binding FadR family transcriptional regulator n=1 Tax=Kibdelosporangium banguiense TaxID=1365924 RepID=A0ABS4TUU1_9PSEU|nr:FCD domain-containing protein [Kibdelosporangium banguiense]MBP2328189.1 DNA-binding FadR family transcriptional regulator [Kibdelosporangium banguiense]
MQLLSGDARRAVFAPLDDGALRSEAVVRRVGSAIALGLLSDGEQLPAETDLATMLNVSTVTLREALSDLRKLGLVETRRGRGGGSFVCLRDDALTELADARLAQLGTTDLRELGDMHAAIAAAAAGLAADRASRTEIARLRDILDRLVHVVSFTGQRRAEGRYYIEVAAAAQSVRLTMQEMELHLELGQLPWPPAQEPGMLESIVAGHRAVVDAIADGDVARARRLAGEHIDRRTRWQIELHLRRAMAGPDDADTQREVS